MTRTTIETRGRWARARERRVRVKRVEPEQPLTESELLIAGLVAEGLNYREIADLLGLSPFAVKFHVKRGAAKLPGDLPVSVRVGIWFRGASLHVLTGEGSVR